MKDIFDVVGVIPVPVGYGMKDGEPNGTDGDPRDRQDGEPEDGGEILSTKDYESLKSASPNGTDGSLCLSHDNDGNVPRSHSYEFHGTLEGHVHPEALNGLDGVDGDSWDSAYYESNKAFEGHVGRPGKVGGSMPKGSEGVPIPRGPSGVTPGSPSTSLTKVKPPPTTSKIKPMKPNS